MRRPETTKYTILVDHQIQAYQQHLASNTNVKFAPLLRALINRCASDPQLEASIFEELGGGYYEDYEPPTPPSATPSPALTPEPVAAQPPTEASSPRPDDTGEFWSGS